MLFPFSKFILAFFVAARFASSSAPSSKRSNIISDIVISLSNKKWALWSNDQVFTDLTAQVPGDLLSDLMMNGLIDDPYIDRNFLTQDDVWIGNDTRGSNHNGGGHDGSDNGYEEKLKEKYFQRKRTWVYSTTFDISVIASTGMSWKLIVEGIKMGANILINGQRIGQVLDQFLRYEFKIGNDVLDKGVFCSKNIRRHNLTISFDPSIRVNGRFTGE